MTDGKAGTLGERRRAVADRIFANFDFGCLVVEATGGWEGAVPGDTLGTAVFFEGAPGRVATTRGYFTVSFERETAAVVATHASYGAAEGGARRAA